MTKTTPLVLLDSSLFAIPSDGANPSDMKLFIEKIVDLGELSSTSLFSLLVSERCIEQLLDSDENKFPSPDKINRLIDSCGEDVWDAKDINRIINEFFNCHCIFEHEYKIKSVKYDNFISNPNIIEKSKSKSLSNGMKTNLTLISILIKCDILSKENCFYFLTDAEGKNDVKISVLVTEFMSDFDFSLFFSPPEHIEGEFSVSSNIYDLIELVEVNKIFANSNNDSDIELAIRVYLINNTNYDGKDSIDWKDIDLPIIGENFQESCVQACFNKGEVYAGKILRKIKSLIDDNLRTTRAVRTSKGGSSRGRKNIDNRNIQRFTIDRDYRLHYLKNKDGKVELLKVVKKMERIS